MNLGESPLVLVFPNFWLMILSFIWQHLIGNSAAKDGEALYSQQKTTPGADCGSDHECFIAKFRLKLKKVGKIARPFRYDLSQIPYDYTVFK